MSRLRSLWFDSRHLTAGAPTLPAELAALDDAARERILAAGDRLAALSLTLAQQYCRHAPAAWREGPEWFDRWLARGESLAGAPAESREAAAAYFALPPADLVSLPAADLDAWIALAVRVLLVSRRLGQAFVAESGGVLRELGDERIARLTAWVDVGLEIATAGSWEAELLAAHFFEATALAAPLFVPADYAAWAELARRVAPLASGRSELFTSVPAALHAVPEGVRGDVLRLARSAAGRAPAIALELYFSLPAALAAAPAEQGAVVASLAPVATDVPASLADLLPVFRAILEETAAAVRGDAVRLAGLVAGSFPAGVVPFYRVLPRLLERTGVPGIERWAQEGLEVAADNADAGVAYFTLDSRTSRAVLAAGSTSVAFAEVEGLLKRYLAMVSGRAWLVRNDTDVGYRPPFDAASLPPPAAEAGADASPLVAIFPAVVDLCPTAEANLRIYRLIAAQYAGRVELGSGALTPSIPEFLASFEHADIADRLFTAFESTRIDAALARAYRGLAADLRLLSADLARRAVPLPGTIMHLVAVMARGGYAELRARILAIAEHLAAPAATVADSARATADVYDELMRGYHDVRVALMPERYEEQLAEALNDAFFDLDGGAVGFGSEDPDGESDASDESRVPPPATDRVPLDLKPEETAGGGGIPVDPRELLRLLEEGAELGIAQSGGEDLDALGLYVSDLRGKLPRERIAELQGMLRRSEKGVPWRRDQPDGASQFFYDEWDHQIADYRSAWCRVTELPVESDTGDFFHQTLARHADLLPEVRRQFQRIPPELYRIVHGLEDGEDFDLNAVITAHADRRSGHSPSPKLYQSRQRDERDVATLFLVDMSASTDEPVPGAEAGRRIIDITKEALVVMSEALEEIGDTYGIYGFSGHGRHEVEFYLVKHFHEPLTGAAKGRVGAIEPKRSTRMGAALRHALTKMRAVAARSKHIILLSDGFPQDLDYGDDRRSNAYGIQDTMMAFAEASRAGVTPFCITVDKAGHDYLKQICDASRYLVIGDITSLPRELPKIYQRFVRP